MKKLRLIFISILMTFLFCTPVAAKYSAHVNKQTTFPAECVYCYTIHYSSNNGQGSMSDTVITRPFRTNSLRKASFSRAGYTFAGWNTKADKSGYNITCSAADTPEFDKRLADNHNDEVTLYAVWTANTNTPYKVYHQQEQLDGSYKTVDTQSFTGTTDTKVMPARNSYTGFTAPAGQEVIIKGDGSASVTYKYARNSYTVTVNKTAGIASVAGGGSKNTALPLRSVIH